MIRRRKIIKQSKAIINGDFKRKKIKKLCALVDKNKPSESKKKISENDLACALIKVKKLSPGDNIPTAIKFLKDLLDCRGRKAEKGQPSWINLSEQEKSKVLETELNPVSEKFLPWWKWGPLDSFKIYRQLCVKYVEIERIDGSSIDPLIDPVFLLIRYIQQQLRKNCWYRLLIYINGWVQFWTFWFFWTALFSLLLVRVRYYTAHPFLGAEYPRMKDIANRDWGRSI